MTRQPAGERAPEPASEADEIPPAPLLTLADPLPPVIETRAALDEYVALIAAGTGPVALDAERASGYRYSARAYLIQVRREGAGTALIDPIAFDDLADLNEAIGETEWILHAATQDLACLAEVGLRPHALFDTELAARLLGHPRVGLATLVETILGRRMRKEHSAVDWSQRPLPAPWLEYAALDVEVLVELRDHLMSELEESGKASWAAEEFDSLLTFEPAVREEPWRRTSGIHRIKGRRNLAVVRSMWQRRNDIAQRRDVTPGRLIPDAAMIAAARAMPTSASALFEADGFHGRGARRHLDEWFAAVEEARGLPDAELPAMASRQSGPPQIRAWADRDPVAAGRLQVARTAVADLSESLSMPVENLLTPDYLRRVMWTPPALGGTQLEAKVAEALTDLGARSWQVELTGPLLAEAIRNPADVTKPTKQAEKPAEKPAAKPASDS